MQKEIALENWRRLTRYTNFNSQINKREFQNVKEEFKTGFICGYATTVDSANSNEGTLPVEAGSDQSIFIESSVYKRVLKALVVIFRSLQANDYKAEQVPSVMIYCDRGISHDFHLLDLTI